MQWDVKMKTIHDRMFVNLLLTRTMIFEWNEFNGFFELIELTETAMIGLGNKFSWFGRVCARVSVF